MQESEGGWLKICNNKADGRRTWSMGEGRDADGLGVENIDM